MSFVAVAIGGSAIIGGVASSIAGGKAAGAEENASNNATAVSQAQIAEEQREYDQSRADLAPYRQAGATALGQIGTGTANGGEFNTPYTTQQFQQSPAYAFDLAQGNKGVEAAAASRGSVLSGGTLKAIAQYNTGMADQEYGNEFNRYQTDLTGRYNRLASVANIGQTATNSTVQASEANQTAQAQQTGQIASNILASGNATASSYANTGNAIAGTANSLGQYFALKSLAGGSGGYVPAGQSSYGISGSDGIY